MIRDICWYYLVTYMVSVSQFLIERRILDRGEAVVAYRSLRQVEGQARGWRRIGIPL